MRLLIIEDDIAIAKCLHEFFQLSGHECDVFMDPREGVSACRTGGYDVVLTDIRMPGLDGIQVLGKIRAQNPEINVIIMTGFADVDNAIEAVNNGAYAFFRKPLDIQKMMDTLKRIEQEKEKKNVGQDLESELVKLCLEYKDFEDNLRRKDKPDNG